MRAPRILLVATLVAACAAVDTIMGTKPCWPEDGDFTYQPMKLEGVLQADPVQGVLWMQAPNGLQVDIGFVGATRYRFGPGPAEGAASTELGTVVAMAGEHVSMWGGYVSAATAPRGPASPGRDGFLACSINGQRLSSPEDAGAAGAPR